MVAASQPDVISLIPVPSLSRSRRVRQRQLFPALTTVQLANRSITALNRLATSYSNTNYQFPSIKSIFSSQHINNPPIVKPLQPSSSHRLQQHVYSACARFRRHSCGDRSLVIDDSLVHSHDYMTDQFNTTSLCYTSCTQQFSKRPRKRTSALVLRKILK